MLAIPARAGTMDPTTLHPVALHSPYLEKGCVGKEGAGLLSLPIPEELFTPTSSSRFIGV